MTPSRAIVSVGRVLERSVPNPDPDLAILDLGLDVDSELSGAE